MCQFCATPNLGDSFHPQPKTFKEKKKPKGINKIGKKGEANLEATAELKAEAERLGITKCEVQLNGCWGVIHGFAHGKKKSKGMTPDELKKFAIAACNECHYKIEYNCEKWTGLSMEQFVKMVIKNRKTA